ncbi:MAG TPA: c-type cytochrome [Usitatibacter sp.]|nr:c-type cytochrome [Usitatibacter sp.]
MPLSRIVVAALLAATGLAQAAGNNQVILENKIAQCQGCHGIVDWKTAFPEVYRVPKLGGQKANYLVAALKAYKSGERDFPTMRAIAAPLTDQDMQQLADYYASAGAPAQSAEKK